VVDLATGIGVGDGADELIDIVGPGNPDRAYDDYRHRRVAGAPTCRLRNAPTSSLVQRLGASPSGL